MSRPSPANECLREELDVQRDTVRASTQLFNPKRPAFVFTILSLCLVGFVNTLDVSSVATALPKITNDVKAGVNYVWIANSYVVAQVVIQPPLGQLCDIFGRRIPMLLSVAAFALGSGVSGGALTTSVLIAGRTIQGLGAGGINVLSELILCDLVPLRERSKYFGIVLSTSAIGTMAGPTIGGALTDVNWRWIFYLNLPVSAITLVSMWFSLRMRHDKEPSWARALLRIDWLGMFIFMASMCILLIGVISGGSVYKWASWRVILPIVLGGSGWVCFHWYEGSRYCRQPSIPPRLFSNRTAVAGFYMNFISSMVLIWVSYFWPVYFQGIRGASTTESGIDMLPFVVFLIPVSIVAGILLAKFGVYRPIHLVGFVLVLVGPGLNILLDKHTQIPHWAMFQIVDAAGLGVLFPTILPAILASLAESDAAIATAMFSFLRSFGFVWGITIPSLVFNASFDHYARRHILNDGVRHALMNGKAYESVGSAFIKALPAPEQQQVIITYVEALRPVWIGAIVFGATGLVAVGVEKHIPLRTELETRYGLQDEETEKLDRVAHC